MAELKSTTTPNVVWLKTFPPAAWDSATSKVYWKVGFRPLICNPFLMERKCRQHGTRSRKLRARLSSDCALHGWWQESCSLLYPWKDPGYLPGCVPWRVYSHNREHQDSFFMFRLHGANARLHYGWNWYVLGFNKLFFEYCAAQMFVFKHIK